MYTTAVPPGRDLLFGVLAVQLNFLSVETLAGHLAGDGPLADRLVAAGALSASRRELVELAAREHLQAHASDAEGTLASLHVDPATHSRLIAVGVDTVTLPPPSMVTEAATPPPAAGETTVAAAAVDASSAAAVAGGAHGRYRLIAPHARGGLGQVSLATDTELDRQVALKEILPRFAADVAVRERFVREAEFTGHLEHPGVGPVYGLHAGARPYYAMRLVRGKSLKDAIAEHHGADLPPADRNLSLRELLGRFTDVCNATAYAHSRGVIHRDLKPDNVMLGKFGETLVVD